MKADIIIPHHDRHDLLIKSLSCIPLGEYNVIVVSGGTFAENCNRGAKASITGRLIFMNDDCYPTAGQLMKITEKLKEFEVVGIGQIRGQQKIYGVKLKNGPSHAFTLEDTDIPLGFLFGITKECFNSLRGFDDNFKNGGEDSDLFLRAKWEGFDIHMIGDLVPHDHSQSTGRYAHSEENILLLEKKHNIKNLCASC